MESFDPRNGEYGIDRKPRPGRPNPGPADAVSYKNELYGSPLPLVYGTAWVPGRVIYAPVGQPTEFAPEMFDHPAYPGVGWVRCVPGMTWRAQIAFCQGPVAAIEYVKRDKIVFGSYATGGGLFNFNLLSEASGSFGEGPNPQGVTFPYAPTFVLGDAATAAPWSVVSGEASWLHHFAYGHVAHMRCERLVVGSGGRFPAFSARVRGKLASYVDPNILAEFGKTVYGALPGDIIRDLVTSPKWGRGLSGATVVTSVGSDNQAASSFDNYCHAMGWYLGLTITEADSFDSILAKILEATNSVPVWSGGGTSLKIVPLGDATASRGGYTYSPPSVSLGLTDDDYYRDDGDDESPPIEFETIDEEDTRNVFPIGYVNGAATVEDEVVTSAMEAASVSLTGLRKADVASLPMIRSAAHALKLSALKAQRSLYCATVMKFAVTRRYPGIEAADLLSPASASMGIAARTVRVLNVEEGAGGSWAIEGVEWPLGVTVTPTYFPADTDGLDYTPDQGANIAIGEAVAALAAAAASQAAADGKIDSFWQASPPATASEGDLWFDADDSNKVYRWTSGSWLTARDSGIATAIANAATAQGTADGKARIYYQAAQPTGLTAGDQGDLWVDTDDNFKVWAWTGSTWVLAQDWYTANSTANSAWAAVQDMSSDGILSAVEKPVFFTLVSRIYQEFRELGVPAPVLAGDFQIHSNPLVSPYQTFRDYTLTFGFNMAWCDIDTNFPGTAATQRAALATWMGQATSVTAGTYRDNFITVYKAIGDLRISGGAKIATASALGYVKVGSGLSVAADGTLSSSAGGGTVTGVSGTAPITSSGGTTPAIGISAATSGAAGSMSAADKAKLDAAASAATASVIAMRDASGWLYCVDLSTSSDRRGKRKVRNLTGSLARVLGLRGVSFFRKGDKAKTQRIGLIAQEAREVVPEVVVEDADGMLSVSYGSLVALLVEAIREMAKRIDRLEARK